MEKKIDKLKRIDSGKLVWKSGGREGGGEKTVSGRDAVIEVEERLAKGTASRYLRRVVTRRAICNGCFMPH